MKALATVLLLIAYSPGVEPCANESLTRQQRPLIANQQSRPMVPPDRQVRVIISSDTANEADDQATIAYALLSPKLNIRGIVAAHFKPHPGSIASLEAESTEASYKEIQALLKAMSVNCVPVFRGARRKFAAENDSLSSEGSDFIVREALSDDPRPLFVVVLGPLTDFAAAQIKDQRIAQRLNVIWIGGNLNPPGGREYNQDSDVIAADLLMKSTVPIWQIPLSVYLLPRFGLVEAVEKILPQGLLGAFLFDRLETVRRLNRVDEELLLYADLPAIGVMLFSIGKNAESLGAFRSEMRFPTLSIERNGENKASESRKIRTFQSIDQRAILDDFFAKLAAFKAGRISPNCGRVTTNMISRSTPGA